MLPYQSLISFDEKINIPMYRYIANRLIALIQQGKLLPGTFLPGTREMAAMINVHRNTVINAYNELISQGWLEAINRKGFQVIPELPIVKPRSFHPEQKYSVSPPQNTGEFIDNFTDFRFIPATTRRPDIIVNDGFPDITLAPVDELMREYRKTMKGEVMKGLLAEKQYAGNDELRQATALFLNQTRGLNISAPNILITRGAQMAIYIAASLLLKPGDEVIVSNPSYFIADGIFQNKGARINYISVDQDGIDVDALEELLQRKKIKLLYVIPHHHHPTTVTLSASRRIKLLNLIQRYKLWVIEDDYDYDFHYHNSPILPLASADHSGQIIYIGSYTKILAPSFRIGYMVTGKEMINQASSYKRLIDIGGDTVMEKALAGLINSGELGRHIKRSKKIYKSRCELAAKLLQAELCQVLSFQKPQGGMAFWLKFFDEYPLEHVLQKAAHAGVLLAGAAYYKGANSNFNHIRFGFASLTDDELNRVVQTLINATK